MFCKAIWILASTGHINFYRHKLERTAKWIWNMNHNLEKKFSFFFILLSLLWWYQHISVVNFVFLSCSISSLRRAWSGSITLQTHTHTLNHIIKLEMMVVCKKNKSTRKFRNYYHSISKWRIPYDSIIKQIELLLLFLLIMKSNSYFMVIIIFLKRTPSNKSFCLDFWFEIPKMKSIDSLFLFIYLHRWWWSLWPVPLQK